MKPSFGELSKLLSAKGIQPSVQRIMILEYLLNGGAGHPTVSEIYRHIHKTVPTLSKSTVYNAVGAFAAAGLAKALMMDDGEARYDANTLSHGHIKCEACGMIYDLLIDMEAISAKAPEGFLITENNVCFKGICPQCLKNKI